jgi:hypothetical protein
LAVRAVSNGFSSLSLLEMASVAARAPTAVGANTTLKLVLAPGASALAAPSVVMMNSAGFLASRELVRL